MAVAHADGQHQRYPLRDDEASSPISISLLVEFPSIFRLSLEVMVRYTILVYFMYII